ncbi:hypothetical protein ACJX0J_022098, partial [Zea mays]
YQITMTKYKLLHEAIIVCHTFKRLTSIEEDFKCGTPGLLYLCFFSIFRERVLLIGSHIGFFNLFYQNKLLIAYGMCSIIGFYNDTKNTRQVIDMEEEALLTQGYTGLTHGKA